MDLKTALLFGFGTLRSIQYLGEQRTLPWLERLARGGRGPAEAPDMPPVKDVLRELGELLRRDAANIAAGVYPVEVLRPEAPFEHWRRYGRILWDGYDLSRRRSRRESHVFAPEAEQYLGEVPDYYRRNFHYQTDGYLSRHSAELYEHQVEILFGGGGDAMRRLLIPLLKKKWPGDGEGLRFLEVGAGTGRLSRFVKLAYPKARVTVSDLSWPYLEEARRRLSGLSRLEFVQAAAEDLPFKEGTFDAVFSCFLFHELPEEIRHRAVREGRRVLREGGLYGAVDSLQQDEAGAFDVLLEMFPKQFHEPFYKNYVQRPLEAVFRQEGLENVEGDRGFLSKAVIAGKPFEKTASGHKPTGSIAH